MSTDLEQLASENEELRAQLAEALETLHAIRSGEVDALVVSEPGGEQVYYTLKGADYLYRLLIENMFEGALITSPDGVIVYANLHFAEFLKVPLEKLIGSNISLWFASESLCTLDELLQQNDPAHNELTLAASDGTTLPIHLSVNRQLMADKPYYVCLVATDLTEINARKLKDAEDLKAQLKAANQFRRELLSVIEDQKMAQDQLRKLTLAVEQSSNSIVITDLSGQIEWVNSGFTRVTGYTLNEVKGKNPRILQSGKTPAKTYEAMWAALSRGEEWRGELTNRRKNGSEYIEAVLIAPVRDTSGKINSYMASKEDITEQRLAEVRIEKLAHFDQLTGLPNRSQLADRFNYARSLAQRSGEKLAVLFLDLDRFKEINDTLGHTIGDLLLIEVARRLKTLLREEDTVARLGGDEFIVILPGTDEHGSAHIATKLLHSIAQPYLVEHHEILSTPSIGIAVYPHDGEDFESLSKNADTAMYRVKQEGRNAFRFFTQQMQEHSARISLLGNALRHALTRDELSVHYQPQVSITGKLLGAEALLRWQHPVLGAISPAEFIPIAEDSGQIIQIGEWVLRTAVKQLKAWLDRGYPPILMAVNLSAVQFRQTNLPERVTTILDEAHVPHEYLELELTEAVAMNNPLAAIAVMDKLHDQGIRMSIDDFGTGYSSLSYLKRFKVYKLKIDQSFVRDISEDPDDKAIVTAIINLASSLGMLTIAEGVETTGQLNFLRLQGCDEVQGYYFSKPLPAEQFEIYIQNNKIEYK
jgi:diguanylate cyclase (GGDEF)-like protein/PAS domain S-box-containing protein